MSSNKYTKRETHVFKPKVCISLRPGLPILIITTCSRFPSTHPTYQFTITTISGTPPAVCTQYNNTWQLAYVSGCTWQTSAFDPVVGPPAPAFKLTYDSFADRMTLSTGNNAVIYTISANAWDPNAAATLQLKSNIGTCLGWPQTLTMYPL